MTVGEVVLVALLGSGAAYAMMNRGKPRPELTAPSRTAAYVLFGVAFICLLLAVLIAMQPHTARAH